MQLPTLSGLAPLAQWHPGPHGPGPHWGGAGTGMGGMGMGVGGGWLLTLLMAILLLSVVVAVLLYAARTAGTRGASTSADADGDRALDALRERYAAGEVDDEEFERRLTRLQKTG